MKQIVCKKCGSVSLYTELKGNNTGLYCSECGAWIKWLNKNELRAFEHSKKMKNDKTSNNAKWIYTVLCDCNLSEVKCSNCDYAVITESHKAAKVSEFKYCPNCGAKMEV
ncbi:MAG: hypothetical protein NC320_00945 [Clostridium sp.]|nr:hypothetical protein [Clostridium sp.]